MFCTQRPIAPPSPHNLFVGKTILVTGANTGLGFTASRTFLLFGASRLILAVRSLSKGEAARAQLLSDIEIQQQNPHAIVEVFHLDLEEYGSVIRCADEIRMACGGVEDGELEKRRGLDILVLNAGASIFHYQRTKDGHETMMQVNYLSNILLAVSLLPLLKATAGQKGTPARITWVGSSRYKDYSLNNIYIQLLQREMKREERILPHFDSAQNWDKWVRYNDTKFLTALFVREFAKRVSPETIVVNICCPGMVNTGITNNLPLALRGLMMVIMALRARSWEEGGWVVVRAAQEVDVESRGHGGFLKDGSVEP
ncbi:hypothetical protein OEA41_003932 [Lepraria neglecta]|uniref:NAD(P)-binding protein n=1 Tax=Lepraria neglecta TaxID=209136 RepID=A0AAD9Z9C2_9LECA|nr:hypothetical protein OEA41_003932 [Lepraria neglecta]